MKKKNSEITVIIPLNIYNNEVEKYLSRGIETICNRNKVIIIGSDDVISKAKEFIKQNYNEKFDIKYVKNKNTEFANQINKASLECSTKYFVVMEYDDKFTDCFNDVMETEIKTDENSIILPFNEFLSKDDIFLSFANEIAWDAAFIDDQLGYLSIDALKAYKDFNVTGALINTHDYIEIGGLKQDMGIAMWYEFLLRALHFNKKVYVTPRVCYSHTILREGSYFETMKKQLTAEEGTKLIQKALEEYTQKQ